MPRREQFLLIAILLLAAFLRMSWPSLTEFKQDEAHIYKLALDLAELKAFPLRGITYSVGLPESPVSIYLYALPLFVWKSPLAATLFTGVLNTLSVGLAYWMTRRYWGVRAALLAALLYATAPWAVVFSRKIWNNNLLPLFTAGYMFSGLLAFVEGRRRWLVVHLVCLSIAFQLHVSAIAFAPVTLIGLWARRRRVDWRMLLAGVVGAVLAGGPYAVYLISRLNDWTRAAGALGARSLQVSADSIQMAALLIAGTYAHSLAGPSAYATFRATLPNFDPILWLGGALVVGGAMYALRRWAVGWRARQLTSPDEAGLIIAACVIVPILFFVAHVTPVYPWYLIILFPAPYLLAGIFLDRWLARFPVLWLLPLSIAVSQVWLVLALLRFVGTQNTPQAFGTPLGKLLEITQAARQLGSEDMVVVSEGSDPNADFAPAVFDVLLRGVPHRFVDGRTTAVFPVGDSVVIVWPGDFASTELYRQWGGGEWATTVLLRAGEGVVQFAKGTGVTMAVPRPRQASALLSNGVEILGSGGDANRWELWWLAPGSLDGEEYHVFAHLLNANGERLAQDDQATYPARDWRVGDLVVSYFMLDGEGVTVRAGMYAYPSLSPVNVLDANGNPAGEWIEFPVVVP